MDLSFPKLLVKLPHLKYLLNRCYQSIYSVNAFGRMHLFLEYLIYSFLLQIPCGCQTPKYPVGFRKAYKPSFLFEPFIFEDLFHRGL